MKWDSGYIYAKTEYPEEPKENFKVIFNKMKKRFSNKPLKVLDLGCASGEFLYYVTKTFPNALCSGIDFNPDLIKNAQHNPVLSKATFKVDDLITMKFTETYDVITMIGVITCFDDFRPHVEKMLAALNPGGAVYIISVFNDYDIDVRLKFRNNQRNPDWQVGYNLFPIQQVKEFSEQQGAREVHITDIEMPFDLPEQDDPLRSWTINVQGKGRYSTNGLMLLYRVKCVEIVK